MLYEIAKEIQARLAARGYALKVEYDERGFDVDVVTENIALISYADAGDDFSAPTGPGQNAKVVLRCDTGFQILVMAVDTRPGARPHEHKRLATHHRNAVLCELVSVLQVRTTPWGHLTGAFLPRPENQTSEYGARYLITGAIAVGVARPPVSVVPASTMSSSTTTTITSPELDDATDTCATSAA